MGKKISELEAISSVTSDDTSVLPIVDNGSTKKISFGIIISSIAKRLGLGTASTKDTGTAEGNVPILGTNGKIDAAVIPDSDSITEGATHLFVSPDQRTKLDGMETGSQANVIESVVGNAPATISKTGKEVTVGIVPASDTADGYLSKADYSVIHGLGTSSTHNVGVESGNVPVIGSDGKLNTSVLPQIAITDTSVVGSQAEMLALTAQTGDVAVRTDEKKSYILKGTDPTVLTDWQEMLTPTDLVQSVNGKQGVVVLASDDISEGGMNLFMTSAERTKLGNIEAGAQVNTVKTVNTKTGDVVLGADDIADGTSKKMMTADERTKLGGIEDASTKNNITLNGAANNSPAFYAPIASGSEGFILIAKGEGKAPEWASSAGGSLLGLTANAPLSATVTSNIANVILPASTSAQDGYMSKEDKAKLDGIEAGAKAGSSVVLNGTQNDNPNFYAPLTAGTTGQIMRSSGGEPSWETADTTPTADSTKLITSGGVKAADDALKTQVDTSLQTITDNITAMNTKLDSKASRPTQTKYTLASASWTGTTLPFIYTISTVTCTATQNIEIALANNLTNTQIMDIAKYGITPYSQDVNSIVLQAKKKPTEDISIIVSVGGEPI